MRACIHFAIELFSLCKSVSWSTHAHFISASIFTALFCCYFFYCCIIRFLLSFLFSLPLSLFFIRFLYLFYLCFIFWLVHWFRCRVAAAFFACNFSTAEIQSYIFHSPLRKWKTTNTILCKMASHSLTLSHFLHQIEPTRWWWMINKPRGHHKFQNFEEKTKTTRTKQIRRKNVEQHQMGGGWPGGWFCSIMKRAQHKTLTTYQMNLEWNQSERK